MVDILGGVGAVVHHQQLDVLQVADEEGLVAGGHHVAGLLVGAIANLSLRISTSILFRQVEAFVRESQVSTYGGHGNGATETTADTTVDTLGLPPAGVHAHEPVTLVTGEALRACTKPVNISSSFVLLANRCNPPFPLSILLFPGEPSTSNPFASERG